MIKKIMRLTTIIACLLFVQLVTAQTIEDFAWLEGTWKRTNLNPGSAAYESWILENTSLIGLGVRLNGADTVFVEKLKIVGSTGSISYVAEVDHNAAPVYFKIIEFTENSFISENPTHDFPKRITYKHEEGLLTVCISGNGKTIPFVFQKTD